MNMRFEAIARCSRTARAWFGCACVIAAAGCASQAYDPIPPEDGSVREMRFQVPSSVERSYRILFERLDACVSTGYHVHPRYEHTPERAWVMVVSGLGLDRYSFLSNRFEARFDVEPVEGGSRILVRWRDAAVEDLARASRGWLLRGDRGCS